MICKKCGYELKVLARSFNKATVIDSERSIILSELELFKCPSCEERFYNLVGENKYSYLGEIEESETEEPPKKKGRPPKQK